METVKTTPKDVFSWVGAMVALYTTVFSFLALLFSYINITFPDVLSNYSTQPYNSGATFEMAALLIAAPLYLLLSYFIRKDISVEPARAQLGVRRWALYLTLFFAGLTMAIDVTYLVYFFFSGQAFTESFVLKSISVFLISLGGFLHLRADIAGYWMQQKRKKELVLLAAAFGILVLLSIGAGFAIVGTPWQLRTERLDAQRVSDLQSIQYQVLDYYQTTGKLPTQLGILYDSLSYTTQPYDPETHAVYEYHVKTDTSFELCATFEQFDMSIQANGTYTSDTDTNWGHEVGHFCFERTFDPARYPVYNNKK